MRKVSTEIISVGLGDQERHKSDCCIAVRDTGSLLFGRLAIALCNNVTANNNPDRPLPSRKKRQYSALLSLLREATSHIGQEAAPTFDSDQSANGFLPEDPRIRRLKTSTPAGYKVEKKIE